MRMQAKEAFSRLPLSMLLACVNCISMFGNLLYPNKHCAQINVFSVLFCNIMELLFVELFCLYSTYFSQV